MNEWSPEYFGDDLLNKIGALTRQLVYISETDAEIVPFSRGPAKHADVQAIVGDRAAHEVVTEIDLEDFFRGLTAKQDWHGDKERERAQNFSRLKQLLQSSLRDIRVFK